MYICYFFIVNVVTLTCIIRQRALRSSRIEHEIETRSIRQRKQSDYLHSMVYERDVKYIDKLCMDRCSFYRLCQLLTIIGRLRGKRSVHVEKMTMVSFNVIAHHVKGRIIKFDFVLSSETFSRHFHAILKSIIL